MRKASIVALVVCVIVGMLLCGCQGATTAWPEFWGVWLLVGFEDGEDPSEGWLIEVHTDGSITRFSQTNGAATTQNGSALVVGALTSLEGDFEIEVPDEDGVFNFIGKLGTDGTGDGTFQEFKPGPVLDEEGSFDVWRADTQAMPRDFDVDVAGDFTGDGDVHVGQDGILEGSITINSDNGFIIGVMMGNGHLVGLWTPNGDPRILFEGDLTPAGNASGNWLSEDTETGTWTGTLEPSF